MAFTVPLCSVRCGPAPVQARLAAPDSARALIVVACGDGPGSAAQRQLVDVLHGHQLATLCPRLDATDAAARRAPPLPRRLLGLVDWLRSDGAPAVPAAARGIGLLCSGAAAAAALEVAALRPGAVSALVLVNAPLPAPATLARVFAPTLVVLGGGEREGVAQQRQALRLLPGRQRLEVVPGGVQRFEAPGTLDALAQLAADWLADHGPRRSQH